MTTGVAKRGDLVIIDFRSIQPNLGVRLAFVIQNDSDNARMTNTVVVQITSNTSRSAQPTQVLIDDQHPDWRVSGLHKAPVINCSNIYTVEQRLIARTIGRVSQPTLEQVEAGIRCSLGLL